MDRPEEANHLDAAEISALSAAEAYPFDPTARDGVEMVQTHISRVFLTHERVYKFRKPVTLSFLDFASRAARNADCLREIALNRRLAPSVYLGIAPLLRSKGRPSIGAVSQTLLPEHEHCVVMQRLPAGCDALSLLQKGELTTAQLHRLARYVSDFHARAGLGRPAPWSSSEWHARFARPTEENFRILRAMDDALAPRASFRHAENAAHAFLATRAGHVERRRLDGRAVDGHGDLHLAHVWFVEAGADPLAIDCLEFSDELRRIDAAADVAFLAMDLAYRERRDLSELFLSAYAEASGDYHLYTVVDYHVAYRAGVRAKVAALTARDETVAQDQRERAALSARRHLEFAAAALEARTAPALVVLCGIVGTGKSTAARRLAACLECPCISSDRLRAVLLADVPRTERYGDARRELVYAEMLSAAANVLESGRAVVLDATFESAPRRAEALGLAAAAGTPAWLVETAAVETLVRDRLAVRAAAGRDPSDAGPEHYRASVARFEAPSEWPAERRITLRTDTDGWETELEAIAQSIRRKR